MARTNNLTNFLTDVASAIKTKTGDSTAIPASQFDTKIANITTGHLDNTEYTEANDDLDDILEGSTPVTIYPPDWSEIGYTNTPQEILDDFTYSKNIKDNWDSSTTSLASKFVNDKTLKYMPVIDTSNVTDMQQCFSACNNLKILPLLDTSNVTNMQQCFNGCYEITNIPQFDTSDVTSTILMFNSCSKLETIPILDFGKVTNMRNMFNGCSSLNNESLNNIMASCIGASSYNGTKTLKQLGISSTLATICQGLSNYAAFTNAGWTTGY